MKSMRFWRTESSDGGASAVAEVLRFGGEDIALTSVEFMDTGLGSEGM